jgi:hypothetical protein
MIARSNAGASDVVCVDPDHRQARAAAPCDTFSATRA